MKKLLELQEFSIGAACTGFIGWFGFAFLILPIVIIFPLAFSSGNLLSYPLPGFSLHWFESIFVAYPWFLAMKNSLIVALSVMIIATILGTVAAYGLSLVDFKFKPIIIGLIVSPALVPVIIVALACYFTFAKVGLIGSLLSVVIGHTVIAVPMVFITVSATLKGFNHNLVRAGASLGASPTTVFFTVTLPLIFPGVLAGAVFAFITSFDEVVIALFLTGPGQITVPRQLFSDLRNQLTPSIVALSILLTGLTVGMMIVVEMLKKRSGVMQSMAPEA